MLYFARYWASFHARTHIRARRLSTKAWRAPWLVLPTICLCTSLLAQPASKAYAQSRTPLTTPSPIPLPKGIVARDSHDYLIKDAKIAVPYFIDLDSVGTKKVDPDHVATILELLDFDFDQIKRPVFVAKADDVTKNGNNFVFILASKSHPSVTLSLYIYQPGVSDAVLFYNSAKSIFALLPQTTLANPQEERVRLASAYEKQPDFDVLHYRFSGQYKGIEASNLLALARAGDWIVKLRATGRPSDAEALKELAAAVFSTLRLQQDTLWAPLPEKPLPICQSLAVGTGKPLGQDKKLERTLTSLLASRTMLATRPDSTPGAYCQVDTKRETGALAQSIARMPAITILQRVGTQDVQEELEARYLITTIDSGPVFLVTRFTNASVRKNEPQNLVSLYLLLGNTNILGSGPNKRLPKQRAM
jgi:hypothetical protein